MSESSEHTFQTRGVDPHRPAHLPWIERIPVRDRAPMFPEQGECYVHRSTNDVSQWDGGNWHHIASADSSFWYGGRTPDWQELR